MEHAGRSEIHPVLSEEIDYPVCWSSDREKRNLSSWTQRLISLTIVINFYGGLLTLTPLNRICRIPSTISFPLPMEDHMDKALLILIIQKKTIDVLPLQSCSSSYASRIWFFPSCPVNVKFVCVRLGGRQKTWTLGFLGPLPRQPSQEIRRSTILTPLNSTSDRSHV